MKIDIEWRNKLDEATDDTVVGWPTVMIGISVGFIPSANTADPLPSLTPHRALLDTGSDYTAIHPDLAKGLKPIRTIPTWSFAGAGIGDVHNALVMIQGLGDPVALEVATAASHFRVVIGRDLLQRYRMIYDLAKAEFTLERLPPRN